MKNILLLTLAIIGLIALGVLLSGYDYHRVDTVKLEKEIVLMKEAKKEFEREIAIIIPEAAKGELAPYGEDFFQSHTEGFVSGYVLKRVFRLRNYASDDANLLFTNHLEQVGYKKDSSKGGMSSVNGFNVHTLVIPFEDLGYVDVKVELEKNTPFDINRRYYDELREITF